jgi:hypothetical protein
VEKEENLFIVSVTQPVEMSALANIIRDNRLFGTFRPLTIIITGRSADDRLGNMHVGLE